MNVNLLSDQLTFQLICSISLQVIFSRNLFIFNFFLHHLKVFCILLKPESQNQTFQSGFHKILYTELNHFLTQNLPDLHKVHMSTFQPLYCLGIIPLLPNRAQSLFKVTSSQDRAGHEKGINWIFTFYLYDHASVILKYSLSDLDNCVIQILQYDLLSVLVFHLRKPGVFFS